jgi:hypothetical protein
MPERIYRFSLTDAEGVHAGYHYSFTKALPPETRKMYRESGLKWRLGSTSPVPVDEQGWRSLLMVWGGHPDNG